jgi:hypothetical protein
MSEPFRFFTRQSLIHLLGIKAGNPDELLEGLKRIPLASVYYHSHRMILQHHLPTPGPPNDFAYWITSFLNIEDLGESLASVDLVSFNDFEEVRREYVRILTQYLSERKRAIECEACHKFDFMTSMIFVMPTPFVAGNVKEFLDMIGRVSTNSLFFHIFDARIRLKRGDNDFSLWLRSKGEKMLADEIAALDPYSMSLEGLRQKLLEMGARYAS